MSSESLAALAPYQLRRIAFVKARKADAVPLPLGLDIVVLNADEPIGEEEMRNPKSLRSEGKAKTGALNGTKSKARVDDLSLQWHTVQKMGPGLQNLGNTCFMNSVLQCLTHTPPLAEALLSGNGCVPGVKAHSTRAFSAHSHKHGHSSGSADTLALTRAHIERSLRHRSGVISPEAHVRSLRSVSKSFQRGRQEDAHEYLIALLDSMHTMAVGGPAANPSSSVSAASLIHRIFAGRICSKVTCTDCGYESKTFDPFLDISLEINRASSVMKALERFTATESLDGSNKYKCPRQNHMVRATKRMAVEDAPAVLVVQLKRFEFSARSRTKISKRVEFDTWLDLAPFMSKRQGPVRYQLFGVLVHHGHSLHAGHYVSFVRGPNGLWHLMDDSCVSQVSERMVLGQKAYMLFYVREKAGSNGSMSVVARVREGGGSSGPQSPRRSSDQQKKTEAVRLAPPGSTLQNGVATAQDSCGAPGTTTASLQKGPQTAKPAGASAAAAKASKRENAAADAQPVQSPPVKRQRVSSDDASAAVGDTHSGSAVVSQGADPVARQCHVRLRREIARALSVSWPRSPSQLGRGQRRMERHLLDHRNRMSLSGILSYAASRDVSPASGGTATAKAHSPALPPVRAVGRVPNGSNASVPPVLSPRSLRFRGPGSLRTAGHRAANSVSVVSQGRPLPNGSNLGPEAAISSPGHSGDNSGGSDDVCASDPADPASAARIGSPHVDAPPWPPLPSATQQEPTLVAGGVNDGGAAAAVSPSRAPQQQQQQQKKSRRPGRTRAASSLTGVEAATALLQGSNASLAASWQHDGTSAPVDDVRVRENGGGGLDDYDAAYDQGRLKKVRKKGAGGEGISSATFQGAWKESRRQHGGRGRSEAASGEASRGRSRRGCGGQ